MTMLSAPFLRANELPDQVQLSAQVCIVGAGPAGLTVAKSLVSQGCSLLLLESGDTEAEDDLRVDLATTTMPPNPTGDPLVLNAVRPETRRRRFGGAASAWHVRLSENVSGLRLAPLDPIDFEARPHNMNASWPFDYREMERYYHSANAIFGLKQSDHEPSETEFPIPLGLLQSRVFAFSSGDSFLQPITSGGTKQALRLLLGATVSEVLLGDSGAAIGVRALRSCQSSIDIHAQIVVLAGGGVSNAQILLNSRTSSGRALGNEHDQLGRYFMDHPLLQLGTLIPRQASDKSRLHPYDLRTTPTGPAMSYLGPSAKELRARALNFALMFCPRPWWYRYANQLEALRALRSSPGDLGTGRNRFALALRASRDLPLQARYALAPRKKQMPSFAYDIAHGGWSHALSPDAFDVFEVIAMSEQAPHPENRIVLSTQRDALGQPRAEVQLRWREADIAGMSLAQELVSQECIAGGRFRFVPEPGEHAGMKIIIPGISHHIGGTRMHDNPRYGVVDAQGRVHGYPNVFVAGSSTFPTGGCANPTLTIVAQSLRLADTIALDLRRARAV